MWVLLSAVFAGATAIKVGAQNVNSNVAATIRTTVVLGEFFSTMDLLASCS